MAAKYLPKCLDPSLSSMSPPTDVTFVFKEEGQGCPVKKVRAHKLILAIVSDVFNREFFGSLKSDDKIVIKDASKEVFQTMIDFIYSKQLNLKDYNLSFLCSLYYIAEKYNVVDLRDEIITSIPEHGISRENVLDIAMLAEEYILHQQLSEALYDVAAGFLKTDFNDKLDNAVDFFNETRANEKQAWVLYKIMGLMKKFKSSKCKNCQETDCLNGLRVTHENFVPGALVFPANGINRIKKLATIQNTSHFVGILENGTEANCTYLFEYLYNCEGL